MMRGYKICRGKNLAGNVLRQSIQERVANVAHVCSDLQEQDGISWMETAGWNTSQEERPKFVLVLYSFFSRDLKEAIFYIQYIDCSVFIYYISRLVSARG